MQQEHHELYTFEVYDKSYPNVEAITTYLRLKVFINENIGGLDVAMYDLGMT